MQAIVFHRGGFCFAKFISGWFKSLRIHTRIHLHRKKGGDRVLRQIRMMLCADFVDHREHTLRIGIAVWQEEKRLHQFRDRGVFVVACNSLQTGHGRPECIDTSSMAGRSASVATAYSINSSQGVVLLCRNEVRRQTLGKFKLSLLTGSYMKLGEF